MGEIADQKNGQGGAFDQPAQAGIRRRIERGSQTPGELSGRRFGNTQLAALPARQRRLGDAEQFGRVALLDAAQAAPASERTGELVHAALSGMAPRCTALARRQNTQARTKSKIMIANATSHAASTPKEVGATSILSNRKSTGRPTPTISPATTMFIARNLNLFANATGLAAGIMASRLLHETCHALGDHD